MELHAHSSQTSTPLNLSCNILFSFHYSTVLHSSHVRGDEAGSIFKHDASVSVIFFAVIKKAVFVNVPLIFLSWLLVKIFFLVLFRFFLVIHILVNRRSTEKDWFVGYYPRLYYSLEFNLKISLRAQTFEKWAPAQSVYITLSTMLDKGLNVNLYILLM